MRYVRLGAMYALIRCDAKTTDFSERENMAGGEIAVRPKGLRDAKPNLYGACNAPHLVDGGLNA